MAINVIGLTIAMTTCVLTMLYVEDELSYDKHHQYAPNLFRLTSGHNARTPGALGASLNQSYPEIAGVVRLRSTIATWLVTAGDTKAYEERVYWAENSLFDVFTIPLVRGDPATALKNPNQSVISESMARKYFGSKDPIGEVIRLDNTFSFTVTGVMADFPPHSHFTPDMFLSFIQEERREMDNNWGIANFYTYLRLHERSTALNVVSKLRDYVDTKVKSVVRQGMQDYRFELQPVTSIHLRSNLLNELETNGSIAYVYILVTGAGFLMLIALVNFVILSMVHSTARAKETALMNILGAGRGYIVLKHMTGSLLISGLTLVLTLVLVSFSLPAFNALTGKTLDLEFARLGVILLGVTVLAALTGLVSGGGVALVVSGSRPMDALTGRISDTFDYPMLKRSLVTVQFALSVFMIISTGVVFGQLRFMLNQPLGFEKTGLIVTPLTLDFFGYEYTADGIIEKSQSLKNELLRSPHITDVAFANYVPGLAPGRGAFMETMVRVIDELNAVDTGFMRVLDVDENFLRTLGVNLIFGSYPKPVAPVYTKANRSSKIIQTKPLLDVVLNETAIEHLGWTSPEVAIDRRIDMILPDSRLPGRIVGVVQNTHFRSLSHPVEPLVYRVTGGTYMVVRLQPGSEPSALDDLERIWRSQYPNVPPVYSFLDDTIKRLYEPVERLGIILVLCALLATTLTILGLLNLVSLTLHQRTKEIGIRKTHGASVPQIAWMLSKEFVVMAAVTSAIACPIAYLVMSNWLQDFAYRTAPAPVLFLSVVMAVVVMTAAAVGVHVLKGARSNVVDALRSQ